MRYAAVFFQPVEKRKEALAIADTFSPHVEAAVEGMVLIDVSGLEKHWPDERLLALAVRKKFQEQNLQARVAIGPNRCSASLMARGSDGIAVIPEGAEQRTLASLPLTLLPASETAAQVLQRWGLRTLGDLTSLSRHALVERLGQEGLRLHLQACGQDDLPLLPHTEPETFEVFFAFDWPLENSEPLAFALNPLLERLCARLNGSLLAAETMELNLQLADRSRHDRLLRFGAPIKDAATIGALVRLHLEANPPQAAISSVHLRLHPAPARAIQFSLLDPPVPAPEKLTRTLARLAALVGEQNVGSPALLNTHRPDAFEIRGFQPGSGRRKSQIANRRSQIGRRKAESEKRKAENGIESTCDLQSEICDLRFAICDSSLPAFRFFRPPLPASVSLSEQFQPLSVLAGKLQGRVIRSGGPWRASGDWWQTGQRWARDEWEVQLSSGGLYRIFRDLLHGAWFVEGSYD